MSENSIPFRTSSTEGDSSGPVLTGERSPSFLPVPTPIPEMSDVELALRKGAHAKYFSKKIDHLCYQLPKYSYELDDFQKNLLLELAAECRSENEVRKAFLSKKKRKLTRKERLEKSLKYRREYKKIRMKNDPGFKVFCALINRLRQVLNGKRKSGTMVKLLGCSGVYLREHLESQWKPGMSWSNYGINGWHVDHIRPCASFNLANPEEQGICFHYTNLQPLWAKDNLLKGARYEVPPSTKRIYPVVPMDWHVKRL